MFKSKSKLLRQLQLKQAKEEPEPPKQDYLSERECHRTYSCIHCRAHLANHDELISKLFQGNHGRAYLFNKVVNVGQKQAVERELLTGLHAVADIYCDCCETTLGWKYEQAFVPSQKYKEGKYIIELVHMLKENNWDLTSYNSKELLEEQQQQQLTDEAESLVGNKINKSSTSSVTSRPKLLARNVDIGVSVLNSRQRYSTSLTPNRQREAVTRRPISTSSSYTTICLRKQTSPENQQSACNNSNNSSSSSSSSSGSSGSSGSIGSSGSSSKININNNYSHNLALNSSGGSETSASVSSSSSQENLGKLGGSPVGNNDTNQRIPAFNCNKNITHDDDNDDGETNHTTTRETIELSERRVRNSGADNNNSAAISVQQ